MFQNVLKRALGALGGPGGPWGALGGPISPDFPPFFPPSGGPLFFLLYCGPGMAVMAVVGWLVGWLVWFGLVWLVGWLVWFGLVGLVWLVGWFGLLGWFGWLVGRLVRRRRRGAIHRHW